MSEIANSEGALEPEKPPAQVKAEITFPPFPDPTDADFEDDISEEERQYYKNKFKDLSIIRLMRLHCTACDRHLGCSTRNESRMRMHPMLRTLVCHTCHTFYNSGEFDKGDDGSELYCRWCGQGGQVYCCSDCPHVFCAKCIKRNLGTPKIKEIENTDDWKCFKCNPRCIWDIRALCWAVMRYCDLKNKITHQTQDPELKEAFQKECAIDHSECCKHKTSRRSQKNDSKKEIESKKREIKKEVDSKNAANLISKIPPTIQVKKFASMNIDESTKPEKKAQKRPSSPSKPKAYLVKNPIAISPAAITPKIINPIIVPPLAKKIRLPSMPMMNASPRFPNDRKAITTYSRVRPKANILNHSFNGFSNVVPYNNMINDNINLSLESLTQGLDMSAVASLSNTLRDDDVVCTPDFPLEPLCEVTEDNDDDVECITPGPVATPKLSNPPPLVPRSTTTDLSSDNIIQMTENDVTVNAATGGLKFRVDPQTLSSNKMYRLPDGRIFAINANPNMPGGYSATIVALAENVGKLPPKGATYAAKLSAVSTSTPTSASVPTPKPVQSISGRTSNPKRQSKPVKMKRMAESRQCDLHVPVEWYRYNLIDAVDSLEYALSRLSKLKNEATTMFLRTRTVAEMRNLHRILDRLLNTSASRFHEIRENLNKEIKKYVEKKMEPHNSEEDDDVEILPDLEEDDPIFIDENSVDSNMNGDNQEVDLTGANSSEHNDSGENKNDAPKSNVDSLLACLENNENIQNDAEPTYITPDINTTSNAEVNDDDVNKMIEDKTSKNEETDAVNNDASIDPKNDESIDSKNDKTIDSKNDETIDSKNDESVDPKNDESIDPKNDETGDVNNDESESAQNKETICENNDKADAVNNDEASVALIDAGKTIESVTKKNDEPSLEGVLKCKSVNDINGDDDTVKHCNENNDSDVDMEQKSLDDKVDSQVDADEKNQDSEMSEEMIENLLKEDNTGEENESATNAET